MRGMRIKGEQRRNDVIRVVYEEFHAKPFTCIDVKRLVYVRGLEEFACPTLREWFNNNFVKKGAKVYIDNKPVITWKFTAPMLRMLEEAFG